MPFKNRLFYIIISAVSILTDLLLLNFILIKNSLFNTDSDKNEVLLLVIILLNLLWGILHYLFNLIDYPRFKQRKKIIFNTLNAFLFWFFCFLILHQLIFNSMPADEYYMLKILFLLLCLMAGKLFYDVLFKFISKKGFCQLNVIIIGYSKNTEILEDYFLKNPWTGFRYFGFVHEGKCPAKYCLSNDYKNLIQLIEQYRIDEVFINMDVIGDEVKHELLNISINYPVRLNIIPDLDGFPPYRLGYQRFDQMPVISVGTDDFTALFNKFLKQTFDLTFSLIIFAVFLWWLMPLISLLIKLDSKGPVFFRQIRTGYKNRTFTCLKFRTMYLNKDADLKQASKDDERITKVGKFLRKFSLDELPQFINVLLGQMSIVGPRPHMLQLNEKFSRLVPGYSTRHRFKPGMTGLAQVRGFRGETKNTDDMLARIRFDIFYIENWSIWLDLKIIFLTLKNIITGKSMGY